MPFEKGNKYGTKKTVKPYKTKQLTKRKLNHKPRYNNNNVLMFHSLLEKKNVPKAYLSTMLNISTPKIATRLINTPLNLTLQQLLNISFLLDININDLVNVIIRDLHYSNCVSSSNEQIKPFVNEDIKILHNSSEWFNR
jgi:hypothetical protein